MNSESLTRYRRILIAMLDEIDQFNVNGAIADRLWITRLNIRTTLELVEQQLEKWDAIPFDAA